MAVSSDNYFSNSIIGTPQLGADIDIFDTSQLPKYAIGFGFTRADGNKYRYCHFGALTARGQVVAPDNIESSTTSTGMSMQLVSPTLYRIAGNNTDPNAAGSRYIQLNHTGGNLSVAAVTADVWAGGYISIIGGSGSGYTYRIAGNTAQGTPASGEAYIYLYDKLVGPVDTTSSFVIQGCKYANVEPCLPLTTAISLPVGFSVVNQTATDYGWVCTRGLTSALQGTPVGTIGQYACVSTNTAGSVIVPNPAGAGPGSSPNFAIVGVLAQTYSASAYCLVDVTLE